jgi:hypothetical protein
MHVFRQSQPTSGLDTPFKFTRGYNDKAKPYKNNSRVTLSVGATSLERPFSGRRDFMRAFNTTVPTGASPRAVASHSEVEREYVGMGPGDWKCPDYRGWVWSSRSECDRNKCQCRHHQNGNTSVR